MILNMPVINNGATNSSVSQGQNEYTNFLKRKYSEQDIEHSVTRGSNSSDFETNPANSNNNWKKRHIDQEEQTNYGGQENSYVNQQSYESSGHKTLTKEQQHQQQEHPIRESQDTNSETFNIIANTSFINDLFAYDANLIVPVSENSLSDSVLAEQPIFSTSSTAVCCNANVQYEDNGEQWQASDLLELDHRYNSSLQMDISQLHPTINLKNQHDINSLIANGETNFSPQQQQPQQQETQFLLPSKVLSQPTSNIPTSKSLNSTAPAVSVTSNTSASSASTSTSSSFANDNLEQDCDFEDKNLSWLLNFKFDEFPHLNPDMGNISSSAKNSKSQSNSEYNNINNSYCSSNSTAITPLGGNQGINSSSMSECSKSPKNSSKTGKKFEELVMEVTSELDGNDMIVAENVIIEESSSHRAPKKPPFTYTELIEYALEDKGELTVSGIYQWISDRFPYYKSNDDRWKNSVRHNLSINPHFRKGHKAPQGAGHLWTISSGDSAENVLAWEHKKQRLDLFFKMESINRERLQQHQQKQQQERLLQNGSGKHASCQQEQCCLYDEAAVAAAAIQQEMLQQTQNNNNNDAATENHNPVHSINSASEEHNLHDLPYNDLLTDDELRKTAGQILNGIHREVEVQSVNQTIISTYQDVLLDNDYLNPIHKDVVVNESGLRHASHALLSTHCHSNHSSSSGPYYVTEIDPMELGIQISNNQHNHHHHQQQLQQQQNHHSSDISNSVSEESDVVLFNDEFNLNYFSYNPANDIVA